MTKLAIFDKFYMPPPEKHRFDMVAPAIEGQGYTVVAHANAIGKAALAVAAMANGTIDIPDVVILGGRLEDDSTYLLRPEVMTNIIEVPHKPFLRKLTTRKLETATTLLPVKTEGGKVVLPTSHNSPVTPKQVADFTRRFNRDGMFSGRAAYVLSHLTRLLLPEEVKIIGISSDNPMLDLPVNTFIERDINTTQRLGEELDRIARRPEL